MRSTLRIALVPGGCPLAPATPSWTIDEHTKSIGMLPWAPDTIDSTAPGYTAGCKAARHIAIAHASGSTLLGLCANSPLTHVESSCKFHVHMTLRPNICRLDCALCQAWQRAHAVLRSLWAGSRVPGTLAAHVRLQQGVEYMHVIVLSASIIAWRAERAAKVCMHVVMSSA